MTIEVTVGLLSGGGARNVPVEVQLPDTRRRAVHGPAPAAPAARCGGASGCGSTRPARRFRGRDDRLGAPPDDAFLVTNRGVDRTLVARRSRRALALGRLSFRLPRRCCASILPRVDERALTERLITYDTSTLEGMQAAAAFVYGWLEARDVEVKGETHNGRPVLAATVGPAAGPTVVLHGHLDVVPANPDQFEPRVEGDRLIGRGAYDMKGGLAAMMCAVRDLAAQDAVQGALRRASATRSPTSRSSAPRTSWSSAATWATSPSPASPPTSTSGSRPRACWRCGCRCPAARRTARRRGWATTPWSRRSTSSAASSRCRSRASPRTCSTGPRSASGGSSAATR